MAPTLEQPSITKAEALAHFGGNCAALARALKISQQAVQQWPDGPIPPLRQFQLRALLAHADAASPQPAAKQVA